jgi:hypothetical protein
MGSAEPRSDCPPSTGGVPRWAEVAAGTVFAIAGLVMLLAGGALLGLVDQALIREAITAEGVDTGGMPLAAFVDVVDTLATWAGIGLVVSGLGSVIGGVWFVLLTQNRGGEQPNGRPTRVVSAVIGGAAGLALSFVPLSPAIGGGVGGYIGTDGQGLAIGSAAGLLVTLPALIPGLFLTVGIVLSAPWPGGGPEGTAVGTVVAAGLLLATAGGIIAGGIGGFIGDLIADSP